MARIRKNDTRPGVPIDGTPAPGKARLEQWRDTNARADVRRFIARYGRVGSRDSSRACSEATMTSRRLDLGRTFDLLAQDNRGVRTLADLTPRQLPRIIQTWDRQSIAPRTQIQMFATLKWFWRMHGLQVGSIKDYVSDPGRYVVHGAATEDRSVSARADVQQIFADLDDQDERIGQFARLAWALGLRMLECLRLQPHEDFDGQTLKIARGAKGGRPRTVSLEAAGEARAEVARQALARLRELAPPGGHAGWPGRKLAQSRTYFYYLLRCVGLTKSQLGVTFHGFRHDYACDRLEELSGITAPVRGGLGVDYRALREHQKVISRELGHHRIKITAAYYGSAREMAKLASTRLARSTDMLRPGLGAARGLLEQHGLQQLYLIGARAQGLDKDETCPFEFAIPVPAGMPAAEAMGLLRNMQRLWEHELQRAVSVGLAASSTHAAKEPPPGAVPLFLVEPVDGAAAPQALEPAWGTHGTAATQLTLELPAQGAAC
jgi:integrase